jgi:hypothetical protein
MMSADQHKKSFRIAAGWFWVASAVFFTAAVLIGKAYGMNFTVLRIERLLERTAAHPGARNARLLLELISGMTLLASAGVLAVVFSGVGCGGAGNGGSGSVGENSGGIWSGGASFSWAGSPWAVTGSLFLAGGGVLAAGRGLALFALYGLAESIAGTGTGSPAGSEGAALAAAARAFAYAARWGSFSFTLFLVAGVICYCGLLIFRKLGPFYGWYGLAAAVLALIGAVPVWMSPRFQGVGFALYLPLISWQILFGIWLFKTRLAPSS